MEYLKTTIGIKNNGWSENFTRWVSMWARYKTLTLAQKNKFDIMILFNPDWDDDIEKREMLLNILCKKGYKNGK